jgi:alanine-glyoxylate transaminase/serine-glyoxylate transaminase/serine-pyruvate transaminase
MSERDLLMIPGPIEFEPAVLRAMSRPSLSHVSPEFIEIFGEVLEELRDVFLADDGQPFVIAGSGTLAMDFAAANLTEPGDKVVVINTGYFSERFADIFKRYGADVTVVRGNEPGDAPAKEAVEQALDTLKPKLLAITQVDTSTAVATDVEGLAALAQERNILSIVDGVCATAGAEFHQTAWGVDVCVTASQKAIGVPPGLALVMMGPRAMEAIDARTTDVSNYYADLSNWLPIMRAYEARRPGYFGTPPVNLIIALQVSLKMILQEGMAARFRRHHLIGRAFQAAMDALGLRQLPGSPELRAATVSAIYYPEGVGSSLVGEIRDEGVVVAGGIVPPIAGRYFRVGHMGSVSAGDILATIGAVERALQRKGYKFELGTGLAAAQRVLERL